MNARGPYKEGATAVPYSEEVGDVAALRMSISDEEDADRAADVVVKLSKAAEVPMRGVATDVPSAPSSVPSRKLYRTYSDDTNLVSPKETSSSPRRTESSANLHYTEPGSLRDPRWSETKYDSADSASHFPPDEPDDDFLGFLVDEALAPSYNYIQSILPNFRDIARSSCCGGIKPNLLFRSARPFGDHHALRSVLLDTLAITTIIDLRDDNLLAIREEEESRLKVSKLYQIAHVSQQSHAMTAQQVYPWQTLGGRRKTSPQHSPPTPLPEGEVVLRDAYREARLDEFRLKVTGLPAELAEEVIDQPELMPLYEFAMRPEIPQALIINVLDAPAVKRRVLQHATERANLRFLPLVVAAKAIDKITGVNSLAPYYFCRFVISTHAMENTYYEMIDSCGPNFSLALKLIALAPGPVLFHCSLGKDRTSILSMLLLHILGATEQGIIFDYALTERAASKMYHDYVRRFITEMSGLPESFCDAGPAVMRLTLDYVKQTYGSIDTYLDSVKFGKRWRQLLRAKYLVPPLSR